MPIFPWQDKKTGLIVEVIRSFSEYEQSPTEDELPTEEQGKERDWERKIGKLAFVQKGENWGGGKGKW